MARKRTSKGDAERKPGDDTYNARRREYRAAQRYLKKSKETSGEVSAKNRALAEMHLKNALETYDPTQKQEFSAPIRNLAAEFGISEVAIRPAYAAETAEKRKGAIARSFKALEGTLKEKRSELEAEALMGNKAISKRILGGLVDVWRDKVKSGVSADTNRAEIQKAVFDYFNVSDWPSVIEILERNFGNMLFMVGSDLEIYDVVKISIQKSVLNNSLVA